MEKKYTMEEFEELYDNAIIKAIEKLDKEFQEKSNADGIGMFVFSFQNMLAMTELKKILFKKGDE